MFIEHSSGLSVMLVEATVKAPRDVYKTASVSGHVADATYPLHVLNRFHGTVSAVVHAAVAN